MEKSNTDYIDVVLFPKNIQENQEVNIQTFEGIWFFPQ